MCVCDFYMHFIFVQSNYIHHMSKTFLSPSFFVNFELNTVMKNCTFTLPIVNFYTVEPIFNDTSNSDNCCYNDRFANPRFFLSLSHVIYFYNNEYKNRFPLL